MELGYVVYRYDVCRPRYYVTLNGRQCGPVYFSLNEVTTAIKLIKSSHKWQDLSLTDRQNMISCNEYKPNWKLLDNKEKANV